MSAAAQPATVPRTPSTSARRQPPPVAYSAVADHSAMPHRTQSTTTRPATNPASNNSPRRSVSTSQQQGSPRSDRQGLRNVQQRDFEQTNIARPDSGSQRRSVDYAPAANGGPPPARVANGDSRGHARTSSRQYEQPTPAPPANGHANGTTEQPRPAASNTQNLRRRTTIDATTGHWELGKTIGAGSMGKVKLARNKETGEQVAVKIVPRQSSDGEHRTAAERERADHSKEIRTAREAAIVTLVDHPYICGMRDVVRTNYHWYMLFEYVNGGQMLDYIISHGRLKEKQARKFGRQIASALDYCHRNSIVHRDLKIENILISKTGDIKIIDFGLSNLFSPRNHLKTFCGSLYFAAPELLQAKQYTGPEVDVWSFGIVLYVLVCGKVPFDDQSMPQLHAKIKKGNVEYPPWLTPECRNLISRMLTVSPTERASLQEIMNHSWMTKGFSSPPENYLAPRKPLQLPLDASVIDKMTGFDFGAADVITAQLTKILESEDYQRAVRNAERRGAQQQQQGFEDGGGRKRGVFDFYKRRNSISSRDTLNTPSSEAVQLGHDPVNAFHPLISIYYLAEEKQQREAREKNPGALALPQDPDEKALPVPDLPAAPQAAYTNTHAHEMPGEKTGGRSRPRARTHGEDEVQEGLQGLGVGGVGAAQNPTIVEPEQQPQRKESAAAGLLRRLSTRKHREPGERAERPSHPPSSLAAYNTAEVPNRNLSVRRTRERERDRDSDRDAEASTSRPDSSSGTPRVEWAATGNGNRTPPAEVAEGSEKKPRSHGLGRSISVNSSDVRKRLTRRNVSESSSMRPPAPAAGGVGTDHRPSLEAARREDVSASDVEGRGPGVMASRARSMGHNRRESMQARRMRRDQTRTSDVPEETDAEMAEDLAGVGSGSPNGMKPVYLKGLFSVSTTSSRPLPVIRADIIRVLKQLGVDWREIKGGFSCKHAPSIVPTPPEGEQVAPSGAVVGAGSPNPSGNAHQRKISFGRLRSSDREDFSRQQQAPPPPARKTSYNNSEEESLEDDARPPPVPQKDQQSAGLRERGAGETSTHVQSDIASGNMVLKFEIFLVKVPLLSLHGIQFKKVDGGTWQYKNMAQTILNELRL